MHFSDQAGSLLRPQLGAMTIGHSPKGEGKGEGKGKGKGEGKGKGKRSVHHLSSRSLRTWIAAGLSLTANAGSCARSCFADGTVQAVAPLPLSCRSAMTGLCMRQRHFKHIGVSRGQANGMHVCDWLIQGTTVQTSFADHVGSCHPTAECHVSQWDISGDRSLGQEM